MPSGEGGNHPIWSGRSRRVARSGCCPIRSRTGAISGRCFI